MFYLSYHRHVKRRNGKKYGLENSYVHIYTHMGYLDAKPFKDQRGLYCEANQIQASTCWKFLSREGNPGHGPKHFSTSISHKAPNDIRK